MIGSPFALAPLSLTEHHLLFLKQHQGCPPSDHFDRRCSCKEKCTSDYQAGSHEHAELGAHRRPDAGVPARHRGRSFEGCRDHGALFRCERVPLRIVHVGTRGIKSSSVASEAARHRRNGTLERSLTCNFCITVSPCITYNTLLKSKHRPHPHPRHDKKKRTLITLSNAHPSHLYPSPLRS